MMDDPWDVKSVLRPGQYVSCMKINGVPLLPPVLSQECRIEMQYYKLMAEEVEKRINLLNSTIEDSDCECLDRTVCLDTTSDKIHTNNHLEKTQTHTTPDKCLPNSKKFASLGNKLPNNTNSTELLNLDLDSNSKTVSSKILELDLPERDYGVAPTNKPKVLQDTVDNGLKNKLKTEKVKDLKLNVVTPTFSPEIYNQEEPLSLSSKSFTGSLNDIHTEAKRVGQETAKLIRQRSYTVLTPSPQLLAHLEVQSLSTGVEMTSISMSESLSNLNHKKRRSWDLESAKTKWSNMALELNGKNINPRSKTFISNGRKSSAQLQVRAKSTVPERRRSSLTHAANRRTPLKNLNNKESSSPAKNIVTNNNHKENFKVESVVTSKKSTRQSPHTNGTTSEITRSEDPATCVRQLYEKIQKEQLMQMANLVEKQKREQLLLQQVFEEQNNILYKQLKTICPKSPIEVKEAWSEEDRGPVSLSQLISPKLATDVTNDYLNQSSDVLKKSRDITNSLRKGTIKENDKPIDSKPNSYNVRTNKKNGKIVDRYDSSNSEYEDPMLTDRTNDTLADLNFTLTDDSTEHYNNNTCIYNNSPVNVASSRNERRSVGKRLFESKPVTTRERAAATKIVAYAKGFLVRRLLRTERVQETVQTIRDALLCALQLHQDTEGIRGADVDLHRRLIQQITAACYNLHDTFVNSTPEVRCAIIAADRAKKQAVVSKQTTPIARRHARPTDVMSLSHSGAFPARYRRSSIPANMTLSNYETFSNESLHKRQISSNNLHRPRPPPWR